MDKKNTMLLTVIAVATLLVAVVGATFAYFSITNTNLSSTTVVTSGTGKIPTISITSDATALKLFATAKDMEKGESDKTFYATKTSCATGVSCYDGSAQSHNVATIKVENGDDQAKYNCTGSVKVTVGNGSKLKDGDMLLTIKGLTVTEGSDTGAGDKENVSLHSIVTESENSTTYPVSMSFTGNETFNITADVWLVNKSEETSGDQGYLAGETITTTIDATSIRCTLVEVTE